MTTQYTEAMGLSYFDFLRALVILPSSVSHEDVAGEFSEKRAPLMLSRWAELLSDPANHPITFTDVTPGRVIAAGMTHLGLTRSDMVEDGVFSSAKQASFMLNDKEWLQDARERATRWIYRAFPDSREACLFFREQAVKIKIELDPKHPANHPQPQSVVQTEMTSLTTLLSRNRVSYPWFDAIVAARVVDGKLALIVHVKDVDAARYVFRGLCVDGYYNKIPLYLWHDQYIHKLDGLNMDRYQEMPRRDELPPMPISKEAAERTITVRRVVAGETNAEPAQPPPMRPLDMRARIKDLVGNTLTPKIAAGQRAVAWYAVYDAYFHRWGVDPYYEGKKEGVSGIEYLEKQGTLHQMLEVVEQMAKQVGA
jgi:hypothetical protein